MNTLRLLTRRKIIQQLTALSAVTRVSAAAGFQATTLHHVSMQVTDLARSSEFYSRTLGCAVQNRNDGTVLLQFEKGHIILRRGNPAGRVDHFSLGIDHFERDAVIRDLRSRGANPVDDPVAGLSARDPDGFPVQVSSNESYAGRTAAFPNCKLDHVSIFTSNLKRSAEFYQKIFGCTVSNTDAKTIRLSVGTCHISLRDGDPAGAIDHLAIGIDGSDEASVVRDLKARGTMPRYQGTFVQGLHVIDPDGYPVQIVANTIQ